MRSYLIGKIVSPEIREVEVKKGSRSIFTFGVLVGRSVVPFDVWDDDKNYQRYVDYPEGFRVCASVGDGLDDKGRIKYYLNDMVPCPDEFEESVRNLFSSKVA